MPYVICGTCRLATYSAALWSGTDECPRCGAALPTARQAGLLARAMHAEVDAFLRLDRADGEPG